jgi:hypothetical protein
MIRPGSLFPKGAQSREALRRAGILTGLGIAGLVPGLILVVSGVLGQAVPHLLIHPVLVLGGLVVAVGASFVAVTHWEWAGEPGYLRVICTIRKRPTDFTVFGMGLLLMGIIVVYSFLENFQPR